MVFSIQLYDRISCTVMSPSRAPPGDAVTRCRDTIDAVSSAVGHKYAREKGELLHLLAAPHIQVSPNFFIKIVKINNTPVTVQISI